MQLPLKKKLGSFVITHLSCHRYGCIKTKDDDGKIQYIARVIRLHEKHELVRMIRGFLAENKDIYCQPSRATIYRLLSAMPAAETKEVKGKDMKTERTSVLSQQTVLRNLRHIYLLLSFLEQSNFTKRILVKIKGVKCFIFEGKLVNVWFS